MRRWFWLLGSLMILGIWPLLAQSPSDAHWRLGHFAIDVTDVDVYLDNTLVLQQVKLATINGWRNLPSGAHTIAITPSGGTLDRALLQPFTLNAQAGQWVTLALAGRRTDGSLKLHAVVEDMHTLASGLTRLSVFNAFPNNPPLTIRLNDTEIIRLLAYPGTLPEGNDGLETREVLAGSYDLAVELPDGQLVKDLPSVGLGVGRSYLLVIFGTLDRPIPLLIGTEISESGTPVVPTQTSIPVIVPTATLAANTPVFVVPTATLAAGDVATSTPEEVVEATVTLALPTQPVSQEKEVQVRFGHFAPGTPGITFYLDSQAVASLNTKTNALTEYQIQPVGQHTLSLVLDGETLDQAFLRQTVTFEGGNVYLVAAIGSLDIGSFNVVTAKEDIYPAAGEAKIGLFNAVPDVREMALFDDNGAPIFKKVAFALAYVDAGTGYAAAGVLPGRYQFVVSEQLTDTEFEPLSTLPELRLGEGRYYTLVITGLKDQAGQPYLVFDSYQPPITATPKPSPTPVEK